ncbi:MAG: CPBP family intramembrane glutamic endopeptidase [Arachnia sp.]
MLTTASIGGSLIIDPTSELTNQLTPLNQLLPAISLVLALVIVRPGAVMRTIGITPLRPARRAIGGSLLTFAAMVIAPLIALALCLSLGIAEGQIPDTLPTLLSLVGPVLVLNVVVCLGEEVLWRGWLQSAWAHWGWFRSSLVIVVIWVAWHLPVMTIYALVGEASWPGMVTGTINMVFAGVMLSALRLRFGSVWPAVIGHATFNTFGPLINSNFIVGGVDSEAMWAMYGFVWIIYVGLIVLARRGQPALVATTA